MHAKVAFCRVAIAFLLINPQWSWSAAGNGNLSSPAWEVMEASFEETEKTSAALFTVPVFRHVAYFIAWGIYGRNFQPMDIPASKLTHLNYAFANIDATGKIALGDPFADIDKAFPGDSWDPYKQPFRGNFWQLNKVWKDKVPQLKTLISVGGWTWSTRFSDVALTSASRATFAKSCTEFITKYGFDGVDLDWEYPVEGGLPSNKYRPEDGRNYNLLLAAIRKELDALPGERRLLTIAAPAGPVLVEHLLIPEMATLVDFVNVMTYDFRGGWSSHTGHHTPLYPSSTDPDTSLTDTSTVIRNFLNKGMPASKLTVGVGFYGRGWLGAGAMNQGLFQTFTGIPQGTWDDGQSGATGVFDYKDIKKRVEVGRLQRNFDNEVQAPWAYSSANGLMISYDDAQSIQAKIQFVKQLGLGGIMTWELSGDDGNELTNVIAGGLGIVPSEPLSPPSPPSPPIPQKPSSSTSLPAPTLSTSSSSSSSSTTYPSSTSSSHSESKPSPTNSSPNPVQSQCHPRTGDPCKFNADKSTCSGLDLAVCNTNDKWLLQACGAGTVCKLDVNGNPYCDFPGAKDTPTLCAPPPPPAPSASPVIPPTAPTSPLSSSLSFQPGGSEPTSSPQAPPVVPGYGDTCPIAPVPGTPCNGEPSTCATTKLYAICLFGTWTSQPCAEGTLCKRLKGGGFVCDWPNSSPDATVCEDGM